MHVGFRVSAGETSKGGSTRDGKTHVSVPHVFFPSRRAKTLIMHNGFRLPSARHHSSHQMEQTERERRQGPAQILHRCVFPRQAPPDASPGTRPTVPRTSPAGAGEMREHADNAQRVPVP